MKELIAIAAYCPTTEKKRILTNLVLQLQPVRDSYDIIIISHSPIDNILSELVDYVYYDKNNDLITDFDLTNKFYFKNDTFEIISSTVFPVSTHLAVYSLFYYVINFAKYQGYKKLHYMEYDFNPQNIDIIFKSSKILDKYDNFIFKDYDNEWVFGFYLSFILDNLNIDTYFSKEKILNELRTSISNMSEHITNNFLSKNRTTFYEDIKHLHSNTKSQLIDSHDINFLNWVIPVYNNTNNNIDLFIYNEHGGKYDITVAFDKKLVNFICPDKNHWTIYEIDDINNIKEIIVYVNNKIIKNIKINESNIENFKQHNFIKYK